MTAAEIYEYLNLWELVMEVELNLGVVDKVRWACETSGQYTVSSAYASRYFGREKDLAATVVWDSRA